MKSVINIIYLTSLLLVLANLARAGNGTKDVGAVSLQVEKKGRKLEVTARVPRNIGEVELQIESDRNHVISKMSDVSPYNPVKNRADPPDREIWFPVVDIVVEPGMEGVAGFEGAPAGECIVGGPFFTLSQPLAEQVIVPAYKLEYWENSIFVRPASGNSLSEFYLRQRFPVSIGRLEHTFELLSDEWSGKVSLYAITQDGRARLAVSTVEIAGNENKRPRSIEDFRGKGLSRERLLESLKASVDFTLRCQNANPQSPTSGGVFLLYDLDARLYRTSHWMWGWGPSVSLLLEADKMPAVSSGYKKGRLPKAADAIGRASLRFQVLDESRPDFGLELVSWGRSDNWGKLVRDTGYTIAVTSTDGLFLAGWGWIPLYEATRDDAYLEATRTLSLATDRLMDKFDLIPSIYYADWDTWSNHVLDESGFGPEGLAEIYRVTGDERYRRIAVRFMEQHLAKLQLENGLWGAKWLRQQQRAEPAEYRTRGAAWSMEGLLAMNRIEPNGKYLELAKRMAEHLVRWQREDGRWNYYFNQPEGVFGISEKGTALWSLLFYRLYRATHDERYRQTARKALLWCMENQYAGEDREAYGSIVGVTRESGLGYRRWNNVSCVYTSAFFGLAAMEELKLMTP